MQAARSANRQTLGRSAPHRPSISAIVRSVDCAALAARMVSFRATLPGHEYSRKQPPTDQNSSRAGPACTIALASNRRCRAVSSRASIRTFGPGVRCETIRPPPRQYKTLITVFFEARRSLQTRPQTAAAESSQDPMSRPEIAPRDVGPRLPCRAPSLRRLKFRVQLPLLADLRGISMRPAMNLAKIIPPQITLSMHGFGAKRLSCGPRPPRPRISQAILARIRQTKPFQREMQ